jgi:hypothetical protein
MRPRRGTIPDLQHVPIRLATVGQVKALLLDAKTNNARVPIIYVGTVPSLLGEVVVALPYFEFGTVFDLTKKGRK